MARYKNGSGAMPWHYWPDASDPEAKARGGLILCARILGPSGPDLSDNGPPGFVWFYWKRGHGSRTWATADVCRFDNRAEALARGAAMYAATISPALVAELKARERKYDSARTADEIATGERRATKDTIARRLAKAAKETRETATPATEAKPATAAPVAFADMSQAERIAARFAAERASKPARIAWPLVNGKQGGELSEEYRYCLAVTADGGPRLWFEGLREQAEDSRNIWRPFFGWLDAAGVKQLRPLGSKPCDGFADLSARFEQAEREGVTYWEGRAKAGA